MSYAADYAEILPPIGRNNYLSIGDYNQEASGAFYEFYGAYMKGSLTAQATITQSIRFKTTAVFKCPSKPRDNYYRLPYMMCAGSGYDAPIRIDRLARAADSLLPDKQAALWADRCNLSTDGNNGGPDETNHELRPGRRRLAWNRQVRHPERRQRRSHGRLGEMALLPVWLQSG